MEASDRAVGFSSPDWTLKLQGQNDQDGLLDVNAEVSLPAGLQLRVG